MLSKLAYLVAVILFVIVAWDAPAHGDLLPWGFVALSAGLLLEGFGPAVSAIVVRRSP